MRLPLITRRVPDYVVPTLIIGGLLCAAAPLALAQALGANTVTIDPAPYFDAIGEIAVAGAALFLSVVGRALPGRLGDFLQQRHATELLQRALGYAANRVRGAGWLRPVTIEVANPWIAMAITYLNERAPRFMREHGRRAVENMLLARIPLEQDAAVSPVRRLASDDPKVRGFMDPHRV